MLRVTIGFLIGALAGLLFAAIVARLAERVLYPGLSGQFQLASSSGDRALVVVIFVVAYLASIAGSIVGALRWHR